MSGTISAAGPSTTMVPYDAGFARFQQQAAAANSLAPRPRLLRVSGRVLLDVQPPFSAPARALLEVWPGRDVPFTEHLDPRQVDGRRPSHVAAVVIQSRGVRHPGGPCRHCARGGGSRKFADCLFAPGHFGNSCGPCKYNDGASKCSFYCTPARPVPGVAFPPGASSTTPAAAAIMPAAAAAVTPAAAAATPRTPTAARTRPRTVIDLTNDDDDDFGLVDSPGARAGRGGGGPSRRSRSPARTPVKKEDDEDRWWDVGPL